MSSISPISSSVKMCLVAAGRRAISSSSAADGQPSARWSRCWGDR
jgi:hypothetical protein